jgi:hypothetical protein
MATPLKSAQAGAPAKPQSPPKTRRGSKIKITKQVSIDKSNKYLLSPGETFTAECVSATGAVRVTKTFPTGEVKKAMVSKMYYTKV